MLDRVVCVALVLGLLGGLAKEDGEHSMMAPLVQVEARRINEVQMRSHPSHGHPCHAHNLMVGRGQRHAGNRHIHRKSPRSRSLQHHYTSSDGGEYTVVYPGCHHLHLPDDEEVTSDPRFTHSHKQKRCKGSRQKSRSMRRKQKRFRNQRRRPRKVKNSEQIKQEKRKRKTEKMNTLKREERQIKQQTRQLKQAIEKFKRETQDKKQKGIQGCLKQNTTKKEITTKKNTNIKEKHGQCSNKLVCKSCTNNTHSCPTKAPEPPKIKQKQRKQQTTPRKTRKLLGKNKCLEKTLKNLQKKLEEPRRNKTQETHVAEKGGQVCEKDKEVIKLVSENPGCSCDGEQQETETSDCCPCQCSTDHNQDCNPLNVAHIETNTSQTTLKTIPTTTQKTPFNANSPSTEHTLPPSEMLFPLTPTSKRPSQSVSSASVPPKDLSLLGSSAPSQQMQNLLEMMRQVQKKVNKKPSPVMNKNQPLNLTCTLAGSPQNQTTNEDDTKHQPDTHSKERKVISDSIDNTPDCNTYTGSKQNTTSDSQGTATDSRKDTSTSDSTDQNTSSDKKEHDGNNTNKYNDETTPHHPE